MKLKVISFFFIESIIFYYWFDYLKPSYSSGMALFMILVLLFFANIILAIVFHFLKNENWKIFFIANSFLGSFLAAIIFMEVSEKYKNQNEGKYINSSYKNK